MSKLTKEQSHILGLMAALQPFAAAYKSAPKNPTFMQIVHGLRVSDFKLAKEIAGDVRRAIMDGQLNERGEG